MGKKNTLATTVAVSCAGLVYLAYFLGFMDILELKSLDLRFQIRGTVAPRLPIVLVSIDQDSFDELNLPWPWPRNLHAALIHRLAHSQAKIIALDILFGEPKANLKEDEELAQAIKEAGNVVLAAELTDVPSDFGIKMTLSPPIPLIRQDALGYGLVNLSTDKDGIVRSAQPAILFEANMYPSFAYRIFQAWVGEKNPAGKHFSTAPIIFNFRGPPRTYPVVSYYRILRGEIDPSYFSGKIMMVGSFALSLHDNYPTPFSPNRPMSGVEIEANFVDTLFANDPIIPFAGWGHMVIFLFLCATTIWFSIYLSPLKTFAIVLTLAGLYGFLCVHLFSEHRLWLPMTPALFGIVLSYGGFTLNNYIREQKERIRLRSMFSKYVSPDIVEEILDDREGLALSGKRRHITVLFSDIRAFTSLSERIAPEQVVSLLSEYLAAASQIIYKYGGTVDKFIGDAVMAIFGAPKSHADDALRAIKAGVEIIELADKLGPTWLRLTGVPLKVGVGINSGEAVVGSIGSDIRSDFTAIGDTVNLASRLEALTKELEVPILISEFTAAEIDDALTLTRLHHVKIMGREASVLVYTPGTVRNVKSDGGVDAKEPYVQRRK